MNRCYWLATMALRYLFIDFDSFFASVEQQFQPHLRGKAVGIVPKVGVDTTCCIAASYEAKAQGVKTGTPVREARYLCPEIHFIAANNRRYIETHQRIQNCIHQRLYIEAVLSIDELYGRLPPAWQHPQAAHNKALEIKQALADEIGPYITGSIGMAPNPFLAKMASKRHKPNGLVAIDFPDLPQALYAFELRDITGIGPGIEQRLRCRRITDMKTLCQASRTQLKDAWGSVEGERMWNKLRGIDIPPLATKKTTIGHSHVLPPPCAARKAPTRLCIECYKKPAVAYEQRLTLPAPYNCRSNLDSSAGAIGARKSAAFPVKIIACWHSA